MKVISYDNLKDFMKLLKTRFTAPRAVADAAGSVITTTYLKIDAKAVSAGEADHAKEADNATNATNATKANRATVANSADAVVWANVQGKPAVYPPSSHNHDDSYINMTGDTMTGALNFANGTWNLVGDGCYMGDFNHEGLIGFKGANGTTGIAIANKDNVDDFATLTYGGGNLVSNKTIQTDITGNASTANKAVSDQNGLNISTGFLNRDRGTISNFNSVWAEGIYTYTNSTSNGPTGGYGRLVVLNQNYDNSNGWVQQIAFDTNGRVYKRQSINNASWGGWVSYAQTSELTWGSIGSKPATATRWPSWGEVSGKPDSMPANGGIASYVNSVNVTCGNEIVLNRNGQNNGGTYWIGYRCNGITSPITEWRMADGMVKGGLAAVRASRFIGKADTAGSADTAGGLSGNSSTLCNSEGKLYVRAKENYPMADVPAGGCNGLIATPLVFNWYNNDWAIGAIRGGSSDSAGFGFAFNKKKVLTILNFPTCK